jgi:hypothetical protein
MGTRLTAGEPTPYSIQLRKKTPGTRRMTYLITGEIVRDGQGLRVLASGPEGQFRIPPRILQGTDGVVNMRVLGLNAPGKLYSLDLVFPVSAPKGSQ